MSVNTINSTSVLSDVQNKQNIVFILFQQLHVQIKMLNLNTEKQPRPNHLNQACQTQTTSQAANATKTDKRAAKVLKKS
jgi:hypothetical protein